MLRVIAVCLAMGGISAVSGWPAISLNIGAMQSFRSDLLADMHRRNLGLAAKIKHVSEQLARLSVPQDKIDAYLNGWRTKLRVQRQVYSERQARQKRYNRPAKRSLLTAPELPKKVVAVSDKDRNFRPDTPPLPSRPNNILANNWATSTVIEQPVHASIPLPEQMWRLKAAYQFVQTTKVTRYAANTPKKVVAVSDKDRNFRPDTPPLPSRPNNILANNWATSTVIEQPVRTSIPLPEQMWRLKAAYQFVQTTKVTRYAANKQPKAAPRAVRKKRTKWRRPSALGMAKPRQTAVLRRKKIRRHRRRTNWTKYVFRGDGER